MIGWWVGPKKSGSYGCNGGFVNITRQASILRSRSSTSKNHQKTARLDRRCNELKNRWRFSQKNPRASPWSPLLGDTLLFPWKTGKLPEWELWFKKFIPMKFLFNEDNKVILLDISEVVFQQDRDREIILKTLHLFTFLKYSWNPEIMNEQFLSWLFLANCTGQVGRTW